MSRVRQMWKELNENERFGCKFGLFPLWLNKKYKPTTDEIVQLVNRAVKEVGECK